MGEIVTVELATEINHHHLEGQRCADLAVLHAIEAGERLIQAKAACKHGEWLPWLGANCADISEDTAQNYMKVARGRSVIEANTERARYLSLRGALAVINEDKQPKPSGCDGGELDTCTTEDLWTLVEQDLAFGTIYADPPWLYGNQGTRAATSNHYLGLTVDQLCDESLLPVSKLGARAAHLHLWTTNAFLFDARRVMEAWGFEYKSCFVWVKPQIGIGNYWRVSHEFLLLGTRGSCPFRDKSLPSWGKYDRTKHSEKPERIRDLIERGSPGPRLELFGRRAVSGWTVWGNEIKRDVFRIAVA